MIKYIGKRLLMMIPVLLGVVLFNLVPDLFFSVESAPRDIWRILALLWAMLFFAGLEPQGSRRSYLGKLVLSFAVCFTVMSTHVVCFVVLPFIVAAWVIWRWLEARMTELKGAAGVLLQWPLWQSRWPKPERLCCRRLCCRTTTA